MRIDVKTLAMVALIALGSLAAAPSTQPAQQAVDRAALEKEFETMMSGAVLVGHSSDSRRPDAAPRAERYTIQKVSKIAGGGDRWLFSARIPFRGAELAVPLVIPIEWAGDTPVISVTDLTIPTVGTYTARVMIYRGHYAGTWSCIDHSGQMWGHIERATSTTAPATTKPAAR